MFKNTPSVSGLLGCLLLLPVLVAAQETIRLDDLSAWKPTGQKNWQIAGDVSADLFVPDKMTATKGAGVLLNLPDEKIAPTCSPSANTAMWMYRLIL